MDETTARQLLNVSEQIAADVASLPTQAEALAGIATLAARVIPAADMASVTLGNSRDTFRTVASSAEAATRADEIQYAEGKGPCVDAARSGGVVATADLATDPRWPATGARASGQTGLHSVMSTRLMTDRESPAGLNVYATDVDALGPDSALLLPVFAAHAATALEAVTAREMTANLQRALQTSREIGTAIGILMSSFKILGDEAFQLLRFASQATHRKLADIALEVVETGTLELPERPSRPRKPNSGPSA